MNLQQSVQTWREHAGLLAEKGIVLPEVKSYLPDEFRRNFALAMDAQPSLTTNPNSSIPAFLSMYMDPAVIRILFSPNMAAEIFGEVKKGEWASDTLMFHTVEHTGEVSSYGDYNNNGSSGANANWPQRQPYRFQTIGEYGDLEVERAGLGKLNWVSEINMAIATVMDKFENLTYFFGVAGLQNYGLSNDPNLSAALTPSTKAYGGTAWISGGQIKATPNEIYNDIQSLYFQLVDQGPGLIDQKSKMVLGLSPQSAVALTAANSFNTQVSTLIKENFPNLEIKTAVQYGAKTAQNPQGIAAGNTVQLIVDTIEGQDVGYCSFTEKMRAHTVVREMSAFKQKFSGGSSGAIVLMPMGISQMVGI